MSIKGGRQVATSIAGIREDHRHRYFWATARLPERGRIVDLGCGVGYGSNILATSSGRNVTGVEVDPDAIAHATRHFAHPQVTWQVADLLDGFDYKSRWDAAVAFEVIEHLKDPAPLLHKLNTPLLLGSVPNQNVIPFDPKRQTYHYRHYTPDQAEDLLLSCGFKHINWFHQKGKRGVDSEVDDGGAGGWTIVFEARR